MKTFRNVHIIRKAFAISNLAPSAILMGKNFDKTAEIRSKKLWIIFALCLLGPALYTLLNGEMLPKACFKGSCFNLEIADTPEKRALGLMNRSSLDSDTGMLFIFTEEGRHVFWMKDTKIPLDIIWIDRGLKVVYISSETPPCVADPCPIYMPKDPALYVLELNSGTASWLGLSEGDIVEIK